MEQKGWGEAEGNELKPQKETHPGAAAPLLPDGVEAGTRTDILGGRCSNPKKGHPLPKKNSDS